MPPRPPTTREKLREVLIAVIQDCLVASGRTAATFDDRVGLIDGVEGFDSLMAVEATVELEARLGLDIPADCIFIGEKSGKPKARTLPEVVAALADLQKADAS